MKRLIKNGAIVVLFLVFSMANSQVKVNSDKLILPSFPIERITLNTDRNIYLSGERIWFSAHCLINRDQAMSTMSNVLYVELYNNSKSALVRHKFKIVNGFSQGSFEIPETFVSDNYFLRAYTQFLKNYPPETYSTSLLTIINPTKPLPNDSIKSGTNQIDILPEFGFLLDGHRTKVAFRVHNYFHLVKGISITDDQNRTIVNPQMEQNGLGLFEITPEVNKKYFLNLIYSNNDTLTKPLPEVSFEGITFKHIRDENNKIIIGIVRKNDTSIEPSKDEFQLQVYSDRNYPLYETKVELIKNSAEISFSKDILNTGINHLHLTDGLGNTILKSTFFKDDALKLSLSIGNGTEQLSQREVVNLNIASNKYDPGTRLNLSVSVVKKGTLNKLPVQIFDNINLLKSYLQNMNSGLLNNHQKNILLIYCNKLLSAEYQQKQITNQKPIRYEWLPEIRDVSISGIVYNKATKRPMSNIPLILSVIKNNPQIHIHDSKRNGEFIFSLNNVEGNQDVFLCPVTQNDDELEIKINSDYSNIYPNSNDIPFVINTSNELLLKEMWINQQTNNLYKVKLSTKLKPKNQYPINIKQPEISVSLADFIDLNSLETVFREIVPNCIVRKKNHKLMLYLVDALNSFNSENPLILIDNIPVFDTDALLKIHPSKIKKIEVSPNYIVLGENIINGVILVTTNTLDFGGIGMPQGSTFLEYQTISPTHGFIGPTYPDNASILNRSADFRTVLYWNPNLMVSENKTISFYTSDHESEYVIIVKGFSDEGEFYYGKKSFFVKTK